MAEQNIPDLYDKPPTELTAVGLAINKLLLIQTFRPDRLVAAGQQFIAAAISPDFLHKAEQEIDLAAIVDNEVKLPLRQCMLRFNIFFKMTRSFTRFIHEKVRILIIKCCWSRV